MPLTRTLYRLSRAAARAAGARLRRAGLLHEYRDWPRRAEICQRCPLRVVVDQVSYCGPPLLQQIDRDPAVHGCGCPILEKARTPDEHCPVDWSYRPACTGRHACNCKWCADLAGSPDPGIPPSAGT